jgi:hypothetical protein
MIWNTLLHRTPLRSVTSEQSASYGHPRNYFATAPSPVSDKLIAQYGLIVTQLRPVSQRKHHNSPCTRKNKLVCCVSKWRLQNFSLEPHEWSSLRGNKAKGEQKLSKAVTYFTVECTDVSRSVLLGRLGQTRTTMFKERYKKGRKPFSVPI